MAFTSCQRRIICGSGYDRQFSFGRLNLTLVEEFKKATPCQVSSLHKETRLFIKRCSWEESGGRDRGMLRVGGQSRDPRKLRPVHLQGKKIVFYAC